MTKAKSGGKAESFGAAMKRLRTARKLSLEDLAAKTGYPVATLEKVEAGEMIPPVSVILSASRALAVDPGTFLGRGEPDKTGEGARRRREAFQKRTTAYAYETLTPGAEDEHLRAFRVGIPAETDHTAVDYHHEGEEFVYVLKGSLEIKVGKKRHRLAQGQSLHFNSSQPHRLRNPGCTPTELLVVLYTP